MSNVRRRKPEVQEKKPSRPATSEQQAQIGSSNVCTKCFRVLLFAAGLVSAVAVFGYYRAPFTALPVTDFSVEVKLEGPFAANTRLTKGTKITGLPGPESIVEDDKGNLYTGLRDGRVVKITPSKDGVIGAGRIIDVTSGVIPNVPKTKKDVEHGRPLGLRLRGNKLFVVDAVYGLYSVDLRTNHVDLLVKLNDVTPAMAFPDDLSITKDGKFIYLSDASAKYSIFELFYIVLEGFCDGRVLQYNTETKEIRVVMANLCFTNGVQLSEDEKLLFVAESLKYRVRVIDMQTWKTKQFVDVPIMPDNVRPTGRGTYWIAGGSLWSPSIAFYERNPIFRQIIAGLISHEKMLEIMPVEQTYNVVLEMTVDGEIIQSLHDQTGTLTSSITQATSLSDGRLVLGTYMGGFLAILDEKDTPLGNK